MTPAFAARKTASPRPKTQAKTTAPQSTKKALAKAKPTKAKPATDYRLGASDVVSINVLDAPTLSVPSIKVDSSGKIRLPMVGALSVAGKTIGQVTREIAAGLDRELVHPDVTVTLLEARPLPVALVNVSGAVRSPGLYDLSKGSRISEVLAAAGGIAARAELLRATLSRGKEPVVALDLGLIVRDPGSSANLRLQGGDTLRIVETTFPIRVAGQVKSPGAYDVPIGSTLGDALALVGNFAPRAAVRKITITRVNGTVVPVDLRPGGDPEATTKAQSLKLEASDLILVPESSDRVALLGAVARPGYFDIEAGSTLRVSQALVLAGGVSARAALTRANLVRTDGTTQTLDLFGLLVRGDQTRNIAIEPGDIITIPESTGVTVYGDVKAPGTFFIEEGRAPVLSDLLTLAGGLTAPQQDVTIRITRRAANANANANVTQTGVSTEGAPGMTPITLSFARQTNSEVLDTRVVDGDSITVTALKTQFVSVQGQVKSPGSFEVKENTGIVEAINRAGGATDLAALTRVTLTRIDGTSQEVDVRAALLEGAPEPSIRLQAGDRIVVLENKRRIYVMEAVNKPGYIPVPEQGVLTVGDALTQAGGPRDRAKLWQVAIFRQTTTGAMQPTPGDTQTTVLNLRDPKTSIDALNTVLHPGEVLFVPQGKVGKNFLQTISQSVGLLRIFGGI